MENGQPREQRDVESVLARRLGLETRAYPGKEPGSHDFDLCAGGRQVGALVVTAVRSAARDVTHEIDGGRTLLSGVLGDDDSVQEIADQLSEAVRRFEYANASLVKVVAFWNMHTNEFDVGDLNAIPKTGKQADLCVWIDADAVDHAHIEARTDMGRNFLNSFSPTK